MTAEGLKKLAGICIPNSRRDIITARRQSLPIRAPSQVADHIAMTGQCINEATSGDLDNFNFVTCHRGNTCAVWRPRQCEARGEIQINGVEEFLRIGIPKFYLPALPRRRQHGALWIPRQRADIVVKNMDLGDGITSRGIPDFQKALAATRRNLFSVWVPGQRFGPRMASQDCCGNRIGGIPYFNLSFFIADGEPLVIWACSVENILEGTC